MTTYIPTGFTEHSIQVADNLGGLTEGSHTFLENGDMIDEAPTRKGTNDQYDAFRHALLAATLTATYGAENAKAILDSHEGVDINLPNEQNMDRWNKTLELNPTKNGKMHIIADKLQSH
ncbi:MAG: hypothetical protein Q8L68_06350 [Methylococcales bacterium]|nr:hypothetical protein [Methylococcales bacterium]